MSNAVFDNIFFCSPFKTVLLTLHNPCIHGLGWPLTPAMCVKVEGGKEPSSRLNVQCCHITPRAISLSVCEASAVRAGASVVGALWAAEGCLPVVAFTFICLRV